MSYLLALPLHHWSVALLLGSSASTLEPDTLSALCADRPECKLEQIWDAGDTLRVIETRRPARNAYDIDCIDGAREFWLLRGKTEGTPPRRMLRLCNDGYGASGIGEDSVEVQSGLLIHTRYGGSNWRALTRTEISLDPVAIRTIQTDSTVGTAVGCQRSVDEPTAARRSSWLEPVLVDEDAVGGDCEFARPADSLDIPQLASGAFDAAAQARLQDEFDRWTQAQHGLGDCALEFGTAVEPSAHVLHGKAGTAVRLRAVALDEVHWIVGVHAPERQPHATRGKWIHEDRLELWIGSFLFTWPEDIEAPQQFGLTLADGKVHRGAGVAARSALPKVTHWVTGDWRWYAIDFSPVRPDWNVYSATVVYGEGDGRSQGLMLGNSRLRFGKATSLGGLWNGYTHGCEVRNGELVRTGLKPEFADPDHLDPLAPTP